MPRIRSIKPEFYDDEKLAGLSLGARYVYVALWVQCDDYGTVIGSPTWLKGHIFPYDDLDIKTFVGWLKELENLDRIRPFVHENGNSYYYVPKFTCHQKIDRPSKHRRNPQPPKEILTCSMSTQGVIDEASTSDRRVLVDKDRDRDRDRDKDRDRDRERDILSGKPDLVAAGNGIPYREIVACLNEATGSQYKPTTKATREKIQARWNEGFRFDDFKIVIAKQTYKWQDDPKMCAFLRPETLFGTKFEGYLNAKVLKPRNKAEERLYRNILIAQEFINDIEKEDADGKET